MYVPVSKRNTKPSYTPVAQRNQSAPLPNSMLNLTSAPTQTPAGASFGYGKESEQGMSVNPFAIPKVIAQGTAQSGAKLALGAKDIIQGNRTEPSSLNIDPQAGKIEKGLFKTLFGTEKVSPFVQDVAETEQAIRPLVGDKVAKYGTAPAFVVLGAFDFVGGGKKQLVEQLVRGDVKVAQSILKARGIADDVIEAYAPMFGKAKTAQEVENAWNAMETLVKNTDEFKFAKPTANELKLEAKAGGLPGLPSSSKLAPGDAKAPKAEGVPGRKGLKTVGLAPAVNRVTRNEDVLLRERIRNEARGARAGFEAGYAEARQSITAQLRNTFETKLDDLAREGELKLLKQGIKSNAVLKVRSEIVEYVKKTIPLSERGKYITMVDNAKTNKDLVKAFTRIDRNAEEIIRNTAIRDLSTKVNKLLDSSNIDVGYAQKVKELMADFELKGHNASTIEKLKNTQRYIEQQKSLGVNVEMPERISDRLQILSRTPKDQITIDQLEALNQEVELLNKLGQTKLKTREAVYAYEKELRAASLDPINMEPKELATAKIGEKLSLKEKVLNKFKSAYNLVMQKNLTLSPMDGLAKTTGMEPIKDAMDVSFTNYLNHDLKNKVLNERLAFIQRLGLDDVNMERIGVHAAAMQDGGLEKLANSGISPLEVNALTLTPQEQEYYAFVRRVFDEQHPEVQRYMREVYNQDVGKVKNYVSFMTDYKQMSDLEVYNRFGTLADNALKTKKVNEGFTKSRAGAGDQKILLNIDKIFLRHTDDVAYMLTMGKDIKMWSEIINSPEVAEKMGSVSSLMWKQYMDLMARKGGTDGAKRIAILDTIRKNLGASVLTYKLSSALVQLTSLADGASVLGGDYMFSGTKDIVTSRAWRDFVMDNFPEVRAAVGDDVAYRELGDSWLGKGAEIGFLPLKKLDAFVRSSTAAGAYKKLVEEAGGIVDLANPNKNFIQEAQKMVRKSQGSSFYKDQPLAITAGAFTGNKSLDKTIFQFQSFMLNRWNNIKDQIWTEGLAKGNMKQAIGGAFWLFGVAGAMEMGLRKAGNTVVDAITGDEDERDNDILVDAAWNAFSTVPIMGSVMNAIAYDSNPVPAINVAENTIKGVGSAINAKKTQTKVRGVVKAIGGAASLLGVPGSMEATRILGKVLKDKKKSNGMPNLPKLPPLPKLPKLPKIN